MEPATFIRDLNSYQAHYDHIRAKFNIHDAMWANRQMVNLGDDAVTMIIASRYVTTFDRDMRRLNETWSRSHRGIIIPTSLDNYRVAYATLYESKAGVSKTHIARLEATLQKWSGTKSDLATRILADVRTAMEM